MVIFIANLVTFFIEKFLVDILTKKPSVIRRRTHAYYSQFQLSEHIVDDILKFGVQIRNTTKTIKQGQDYKLVKRIQKEVLLIFK